MLYSPDEVAHVTFVKRALALDFPVATIRDMLGRVRRKPSTCDDIYTVAELHLADVRREIARLTQIEASLAPLVEICSRQGPRERCPIFAALSHQAKAANWSRGRQLAHFSHRPIVRATDWYRFASGPPASRFQDAPPTSASAITRNCDQLSATGRSQVQSLHFVAIGECPAQSVVGQRDALVIKNYTLFQTSAIACEDG
jgi:DNA-binding transcriptional MerR regulator